VGDGGGVEPEADGALAWDLVALAWLVSGRFMLARPT